MAADVAHQIELVGYIGQQSNLTSTLDSSCQLTLMLGTGAGGPARQDLAALGEIAAELRSVLIVDMLDFVNTESAHFTALTASDSIVRHG